MRKLAAARRACDADRGQIDERAHARAHVMVEHADTVVVQGVLLDQRVIARQKHAHAAVVMDVLQTHPLVIVGGILRENPFYVPPDEFLRELDARKVSAAPSGV